MKTPPLQPLPVCNFIKKRLQNRCFPVNITKFLRRAFSVEHLRCLFLSSRHNHQTRLAMNFAFKYYLVAIPLNLIFHNHFREFFPSFVFRKEF